MHQLPEVKFHDSRYKTLLALDHNKMDVKHVLEKIEQNKQIFTSLADPILTGNLALPDDWSSPNYDFCYDHCMSFVIDLYVLCLFCKADQVNHGIVHLHMPYFLYYFRQIKKCQFPSDDCK